MSPTHTAAGATAPRVPRTKPTKRTPTREREHKLQQLHTCCKDCTRSLLKRMVQCCSVTAMMPPSHTPHSLPLPYRTAKLRFPRNHGSSTPRPFQAADQPEATESLTLARVQFLLRPPVRLSLRVFPAFALFSGGEAGDIQETSPKAQGTPNCT